MRLWHSKLIPLLDGRRLCDLHMSCCNLRGKGWGKRNAAVGYLYEDPLGEDALTVYHHLVLKEMRSRGYKYDSAWVEAGYCGKNRPARTPSWENYLEASRREVPLKGHTPGLFIKDVEALYARGLPIEVKHVLNFSPSNLFPEDRYLVRNAETNKHIQYTFITWR